MSDTQQLPETEQYDAGESRPESQFGRWLIAFVIMLLMLYLLFPGGRGGSFGAFVWIVAAAVWIIGFIVECIVRFDSDDPAPGRLPAVRSKLFVVTGMLLAIMAVCVLVVGPPVKPPCKNCKSDFSPQTVTTTTPKAEDEAVVPTTAVQAPATSTVPTTSTTTVTTTRPSSEEPPVGEDVTTAPPVPVQPPAKVLPPDDNVQPQVPPQEQGGPFTDEPGAPVDSSPGEQVQTPPQQEQGTITYDEKGRPITQLKPGAR